MAYTPQLPARVRVRTHSTDLDANGNAVPPVLEPGRPLLWRQVLPAVRVFERVRYEIPLLCVFVRVRVCVCVCARTHTHMRRTHMRRTHRTFSQVVSLGPLFQAVNVSLESGFSRNSRFISLSTSGCANPITWGACLCLRVRACRGCMSARTRTRCVCV